MLQGQSWVSKVHELQDTSGGGHRRTRRRQTGKLLELAGSIFNTRGIQCTKVLSQGHQNTYKVYNYESTSFLCVYFSLSACVNHLE